MEDDSILDRCAVAFVDMSKDMQFWFYGQNLCQELFAACVHVLNSFVLDSVGRAMGHHHVGVFGNHAPELFRIFLAVHETPVEELEGVRRPKYLYSFHFHRLVLEVGADLFKFFNLSLCVDFGDFVGIMLPHFERALIGIFIECEIVVASDDYFMFVRQEF